MNPMTLKIDDCGILDGGVFQVSEERELYHQTRAGWSLVAALYEPHVPTPGAEGTPGYPVRYDMPKTGCWKFLLRQTEESALASMVEKLDQAEQRTRKAQEETRKLREDAAAAEKQAAGAKELAERMEKERGRVQAVLDAERLRSRRTEEDIGKLRAALGELRMNEILGEKNES